MDCDLLIIGGGIVGLATGRELLQANPGLRIIVLEKESSVAQHQTGRNSGVIHAGVYYAPGSLKAAYCRQGVSETIAFCREHAIAYEQCGKMLVATNDAEHDRMAALEKRCIENAIKVERLDAAELTRREPNITGVGALFVPTTGIVDYARMSEAMVKEIEAGQGQVITSSEVTEISETGNEVTIRTSNSVFRTKYLVVCGGIYADRLAAIAGIAPDFRMVPFRGEYFRLAPRHNSIVNHLIYPIPDPELPFLGVHLTKMIGGYVTAGPNAVLAFAREGYRFFDFNFRDMRELANFSGFRRMLAKNFYTGLQEFRNSLSKRRYLELCRKYCPALKVDDLLPYPSGIRAQAVMTDGTLVHDFMIKQTERMLHICNAPSPAATSAIPIARHVTQIALQKIA